MNINITRATVLIVHGADKVSLQTDLPSPFASWLPDEKLSLNFEVTKGLGAQYVRDNFGLEPEIINTISCFVFCGII